MKKELSNIEFTREDVTYFVELLNHRGRQLKNEAINFIEQEENGEITMGKLDSSLSLIHAEQERIETLQAEIMEQIKEQLYK